MLSGSYFAAKDSLAHASSDGPPTEPAGGASMEINVLESPIGPLVPPSSVVPPVPVVVPKAAPAVPVVAPTAAPPFPMAAPPVPAGSDCDSASAQETAQHPSATNAAHFEVLRLGMVTEQRIRQVRVLCRGLIAMRVDTRATSETGRQRW